jgi:hypothetical protein
MRESGLTPAPVILDAREQRFTARLPNACSRKLKELHHNPSSSAPICKVTREEHEHGRTSEGTDWPPLGEESMVRTTILDDTRAAKSAAQRCARDKEANVRAGLWMWWTDVSRSDNDRVGAAAVCKHGNEWMTRRRFLRTGRMEVIDTELRAIGLSLEVEFGKREKLQEHGVKTMAVFSDRQAAIL